MGIAFRTLYFGPDHAMSGVAMLANYFWIKGGVIAGPATTRIKLSR